MTPRTVTILWVVALVITLGTAAFHAGCGSATKPSTAKPEPLQTEDIPFTCIRIERAGDDQVIICSSKPMCEHIGTRLAYYWDPLATRYTLTGMSECTDVAVRFSARE